MVVAVASVTPPSQEGDFGIIATISTIKHAFIDPVASTILLEGLSFSH